MADKKGITSKAALARELRMSRSRLTQLEKTGLPVLENGKLNRRAVLEWLAKYSSGFGGGWHSRRDEHDISERARELLNGSDSKNEAVSEFTRGAEWMARQICESARRAWPGLVSEIRLGPKQTYLQVRVIVATVAVHVIEGQLKDWVDSNSLPEVDWAAFGDDAAAAAKESLELRADWDSEAKG